MEDNVSYSVGLEDNLPEVLQDEFLDRLEEVRPMAYALHDLYSKNFIRTEVYKEWQRQLRAYLEG